LTFASTHTAQTAVYDPPVKSLHNPRIPIEANILLPKTGSNPTGSGSSDR